MGGGCGSRCNGVEKSIPKEEKEGRVIGWLCRHLPPAPERRPLRQDRRLVAVLLVLTSALSRFPFSHFFISCRHCSFPTGPLTAQLAGVAVRSQSQLSPSPALLPFSTRFHTIWYGKLGGCRSQPVEMGERRSISIFYRCYLALELNEGREGLSFWFFRGQVGRTELSVYAGMPVGIKKLT